MQNHLDGLTCLDKLILRVGNIMSKPLRVGVVGGGISGIAAAYFLNKKGYEVEVVEADGGLGGRTGSAYLGDRQVGFGGKNIGRQYPLFRKFVKEQGDFEWEYFGINTSSTVDGKSRVIDTKKPVQALLNMVALTGVKDFLKIVPMMLAIKRSESNGYLGGRYFRKFSGADNNITMSEYFDEKCAKNFVRPITIRMNGSEPENYYLGNFGSNLKMIMDKYDQLTDGIHSVIDKFSPRISVKTNTKVMGLVERDGNVLGVVAEKDGRLINLSYDAVVIATPAPIAAGILRNSNSELCATLNSVKYNPVAIAVAKYNKDVFNKTVRARVFGSDHCLSNAGAYGINDLDIVRYTFSGKLMSDTIDECTDPEAVLTMGERSLNTQFSLEDNKRECFVYRYFKYGYCAYSPNHFELIETVKKVTRDSYRGLYITGDYMRGAALEACFRSADETANMLTETMPQSVSELRRAG